MRLATTLPASWKFSDRFTMPSTAAYPSAVRVLIAHRYLWPDNLSLYPAMLKDIVEWHVVQGHEVTVLAAQARETQRRLEWARHLKVTLIEPRLGSDRGHGALWRLATMLGYFACLVKTLATQSFDLVLVSSNPPVAAATTVRWMARWGRYRYLYYLQDHFPEGMQRKLSLVARLIGRMAGWLDRKNVDAAAAVLTLSAGMKQTLLRRGCHGRNLHVLQNFSVDDPEGATKHASTDVPTLVFAGNLGALQNLPHFLRASKLAANSCPHKVQILGWGSEAERLKQLAVDEAMDHVEFHGVVPRHQAQRRIAECEAGVVAAAPCLFDIAYPSKTASYLTAGLPVLVFVEPDNPVAHELGQQRLGVAASPSDLTHASTAIKSLVRGLTRGDFQANTIQQQATRLFSKDNYFQGYAKVMTGLTPNEEPKMLNYSKDQIRFDSARFNFAELVLDAVNHKLQEEGVAPIAQLSEIHTVPQIAHHLEAFRQHLFSLFRTPPFQKAFREFGKSLIETHFTQEAVIQKTPTVRIQLAGGKSVSFHSDAWYGHGERVNSFWLPLTRVWGSNSLQIARNVEESIEFLERIAYEQLDLDEINVQAAELCEPVHADFGDLVVFNGDVVHGTLNNESGSSRVSFDFRIAHSLQEIGTKPAANFYTYEQLSHPLEESTTASAATPRRRALMYSGICRGVSAKSQLVFLNEYARINNIDIVGSESEIVVFDYAPVLQKYAKNPEANMDCILLFSVDLLPSDRALRDRVYRGALKNSLQVVFGAEDLVLSKAEDIQRIERLLESRPTLSTAAA